MLKWFRMHSTQWRIGMLISALLLAITTALIPTPVVVSASNAVPADCEFYGSTDLQPSGQAAVGTGNSTYQDGDWNVGTDVSPCGTGSGTSIRVETWMDGAQGPIACESPANHNASGACMTVLGEARNVIVDWYYSESGPLSGVWYAHSKHYFIAASSETFQFQDTYDQFDFTGYTGGNGGGNGDEDPPDEEGGGGTPIVMPLGNSQAFKLTSAAEGVPFDLDADGTLEQIAWTAADSKLGFLAIDRNGNGSIDNGSELFGDHTVPGVKDGFAALRLIMPQADDAPPGPGYINANDPLYSKLLLWEDRNHNGLSEPDELQPLSNLYTQIRLGYSGHNRKDGNGNEFRYKGAAEIRTAPGQNRSKDYGEQKTRLRAIYDVVFVKQ